MLSGGYVLYRYTCESCGKETDWLRKDVQYIKEPDKRRPTESFMSGGRMESWAAPASAAAGESAGDRENRERREQRLLNGLFAVIRSKADSGNYAEFDKGSSCPFCRARQSWCNATPLGDIVLSAVGTAVLFAAAAVILSLVLSRYGPWGTVVPIIACALLGECRHPFQDGPSLHPLQKRSPFGKGPGQQPAAGNRLERRPEAGLTRLSPPPHMNIVSAAGHLTGGFCSPIDDPNHMAECTNVHIGAKRHRSQRRNHHRTQG